MSLPPQKFAVIFALLDDHESGHWTELAQNPVLCSCEHGDEHYGSLWGRDIFLTTWITNKISQLQNWNYKGRPLPRTVRTMTWQVRWLCTDCVHQNSAAAFPKRKIRWFSLEMGSQETALLFSVDSSALVLISAEGQCSIMPVIIQSEINPSLNVHSSPSTVIAYVLM
jgi:hypothetical protein